MITAELDVPQLAEAAAERLRSWIVGGWLRPNERVRERDIAARLRISRTPTREALRLLQGEGLVTGHPRRGMLVAPLCINEITSTYQVLAALERAALLHTPTVSREMIRRLRTATRKRNAAAKDAVKSMLADLEWHRALTGYTSNESLHGMLETRRLVAERYERAFFRSAPDVSRSSVEHDDIQQCVEAGQLEHAAALVERHWLGNIPAMQDIITQSRGAT